MRAAKLPRMLAASAAAILIATAAFHATGFSDVLKAVGTPSVPEFVRRTSPGLWLFFAWHLFALATAAGWAAFAGLSSARPLLIFCTAVVIVDTVFVFSQAGLFAGTLMLAAAAVCLVLAALRWYAS